MKEINLVINVNKLEKEARSKGFKCLKEYVDYLYSNALLNNNEYKQILLILNKRDDIVHINKTVVLSDSDFILLSHLSNIVKVNE